MAETATTNDTGSETPLPVPGARMQRAIQLNGFGGLKYVKVIQQEEPAVEKGFVRVRVKACGVNFLDLMTRQGLVESGGKPPFVLGCECAGEVEALGEEVENLQVGDRVVVLQEQGCWAEAVCAPADYCFKLPSGLSYNEAAAMAVSYLAAHIILRHLVGVSSGDTVLVHSAGGAVGLAMSQLCQKIGNVNLIGVASKSKHEVIGDKFTVLIEREKDYVAEIRAKYPQGVKVVLDCLSGEDINKGLSLLQPLGKYVLYGSSNFVTGETKSLFSFAKSWWQVDKINPMKLHEENKMIGGFNLKSLLFRQGQAAYVRQCLHEIFDAYQKGEIKPTVDSTWALEDICDAMQKLHDRKNIGKIILDPSAEPAKKEEKATTNATQDVAATTNKQESDKK